MTRPVTLVPLLILALFAPLIAACLFAGRTPRPDIPQTLAGLARSIEQPAQELWENIRSAPRIGPRLQARFKNVDRFVRFLSRGAVHALLWIVWAIAFLLVGLLYGARARKKHIDSFSFSSPTMLLLSRSAIPWIFVAFWICGFVPLGTPVGALVFLGLCLAMMFAGRLAAKHFPVVW